MKIAICLYGQPRNYKKGYDVLSNFIHLNSSYDFDFFLHTWTIQENETYNVSPWRPIHKDEIVNTNIQEIIHLYNPKSHEIENQINTFDEQLYIHSIAYNNTHNQRQRNNINNTLSQLYSKNKVRKLFNNYMNQTNTKYEAVIICRFDFMNEIQLDLSTIDLNYVYTSFIGRSINIPNTSFCIMPVNIFIKWFNMFDNLLYTINNTELHEIVKKNNHIYTLNIEEIEVSHFIIYFGTTDIIKYISNIPDFH